MKFDDASQVDQICWQMRTADWPRAKNRAAINSLFNGAPPYTDEEVAQNNINVNVNSLEGTRIAHDARSQFYSAFLKPGRFFKLTTDIGTVSRRQSRASTVERHINRVMKRDLSYFECFRSKFAMDVLHGIGPSAWVDSDHWCPDPIGVEDVLIPANTYLTCKNLPFFALYRSLTSPELMRMAKGPKADPAWNQPLVDKCLAWVDKETMALMGSNWPEIWSPEKATERVKGDGGFYVGDQVPTIDVWDFYFWDDNEKEQGWYRRMILDAWSAPSASGGVQHFTRRTGDLHDAKGEFLYNPGDRKFSNKREEIICFQFADLSAVAPFRYHSVRSLGFLLYSVCHIQNRLRCKFNEAVFESLMMLFRVKSMDDVERALKVELASRGFIDDTLTPVPASERWQPNSQLIELGLGHNSQLIQENSSSYVQNQNYSRDRVEKTKFQVMAEVNAMTSLTSAALVQAYQYQAFEYYEILRRFMKKDSRDPDVRSVRAACLAEGVPEKLLHAEAWDLEPERVMGAGNKTLEVAIAQQLMEWRDKYDAEPQRQILRDATLAITDDPARATSLVPEGPVISSSIHDAQVAFGTLMAGAPVAPKAGLNTKEVVQAWLASMGIVVARIEQSGGMATKEELIGLQNVGAHIQNQIQLLARDKDEKALVKKYGDALGKLMNMVKAFAQRFAEQQQKSQQANGNGMDPKDKAKIMATMATAQAKVKNMRESHAERTAQRRLQFEQQTRQDAEKHQADIAARDLEAASQINRNRLKSLTEDDGE